MNGRQLLPGVVIASKPEWSCVVNNDKIGCGVLSWHHDKAEAQHNANLTGGKVIPVDYINGELIVPYLAQAIVKKMNGPDKKGHRSQS